MDLDFAAAVHIGMWVRMMFNSVAFGDGRYIFPT
jgi:hypothetical protein